MMVFLHLLLMMMKKRPFSVKWPCVLPLLPLLLIASLVGMYHYAHISSFSSRRRPCHLDLSCFCFYVSPIVDLNECSCVFWEIKRCCSGRWWASRINRRPVLLLSFAGRSNEHMWRSSLEQVMVMLWCSQFTQEPKLHLIKWWSFSWARSLLSFHLTSNDHKHKQQHPGWL